MSDVYIVVLGIDEYIKGIAGVYASEERAEDAVDSVDRSGLWGDGDQWINLREEELVE